MQYSGEWKFDRINAQKGVFFVKCVACRYKRRNLKAYKKINNIMQVKKKYYHKAAQYFIEMQVQQQLLRGSKLERDDYDYDDSSNPFDNDPDA